MAKAVLNNASVYSDRWVNGMTNAVTKIEQGVDAVTQSPGVAAADQKSAYLQGVQRSANIWEQRLRNMDMNDWKQRTKRAAATRIPEGASNAKAKMQAVGAKLLPAIQSIVSGLPPRGSEAQNKARMLAMFDGMKQLKGTI